MKNPKRKAHKTGVGYWLFMMMALTAGAQTVGPYVRLDGGLNMIPDVHIDAGGFPGNIAFDYGYRLSAAVGYDFNRWLGVELESGYFYSSIKTVHLYDTTVHVDDSSLNGIPVLANLVFRYENRTAFMPYVAVGAGGVRTALQISGDDDSDIVFTAQFQAGLVYKIDEEAWIEIRYKLLGTPKQNYGLNGSDVETDRLFTHFIGAGAVWRF